MSKLKKIKKVNKMPKNMGVGKTLRAKRTLFTRKEKKVEIGIVTRKEQPFPKTGTITSAQGLRAEPIFLRQMKVTALERQDIPLQRVSSSWLQELGYHPKERLGIFTTLPRKNYGSRGYYVHNFPWNKMQMWYYAHSKGTFFNYFVRDKYKITRYR